MIPHLRVENISNTITVNFVNNFDLLKDRLYSPLTADVTTSNSTLQVQSITGFTTNQLLCIGEIEQGDTEIVLTHASTSPSGNTVTLASTLIYNHSQDTKVYIVQFNVAEFDWSSTPTGGKTELGTMAIDMRLPETQYTDYTQSSGYYFARFYDAPNGTAQASAWSNPVPYGEYADNSVFSIKKRALDDLDEEIGKKITHEYLNQSLWEARREFHKAPGKRPFRRKYNVDIGNVSTGMYRILVPNDLEEPETDSNVYGVRIGTEDNMSKYDKKKFDQDYRDIPHTTLNADYVVGNIYLGLTDCRDFDTSGSVNIAGDGIEYSAKDISTGSLTISADGDASHSTGDDVWQNVSFGLPTKFCVFVDSSGSSYVYFNRPIETMYVDQNIYMDYYRTLVESDSDADTLDEPEYDFYVDYLKWKIKKKKQPDLKAQNDDDYGLWLTKKNEILIKEEINIDIHLIPDIDHLI